MIIRVVQMKFRQDAVHDFQKLFEGRKHLIKAFAGCNHLELWQDAHDTAVFFTYSIWDSEEHLNHYRFSALFKDTWTRAKALFADAPQAWSLVKAG